MTESVVLREIVSRFFPLEWPTVDANKLMITKIADGLVNTVMVVSRPRGGKQEEPHHVVVRRSGGMLVPLEEFPEFSKLSDSEELLVVADMSRYKWGPKLYGVFAGGRVEEYIASHTLSARESSNADLRRDIAKSYARFHSLQPPLKKDKFQLQIQDMMSVLQLGPDERQQMRDKIFATGSKYAGEAAVDMLDHSREFSWSYPLLKRNKCAQSFTILDGNYLNILVRDTPTPEGKIVLVDYELAKYGYRGFDIGAHFVNRLIEWQNKEDKHSGVPYPDKEERMIFVREYLSECWELGRTERAEIDTVDHLMLEADIGAIIYSCYMSAVLYRYMDVFLKDSSFVSSMKCLNDTYNTLKKEFVRKRGDSNF